MPKNLHLMILAELRAVFGRASGIVALVIAVLCGVMVASIWAYAQHQTIDAQINNEQVSTMMDLTLRGVLGRSLWMRNFFVLPMFLVLSSAGSFASELADHTLREDLVRPVPRWSVVLAKVVALATLSASTLILTFSAAAIGGALTFGTDAEISRVALGYLASWLSDLGLVAISVVASIFVRNVGLVVVGVIFFLFVDAGARAALGLLGAIGVEWAGPVARALPGAALACWEGWSDAFEPERFGGLLALILIGYGLSLARLQRMDVP